MPTYEYACSSCGNVWEEVQRITADASDTCPKCGQKTAKRQINGGNFILKGGGWYADLYSSSKPGASSGSSSGTSASSSAGESKSDASAPAPSAASSDSGSSSSSGGTSGGSTGGSSGSSSST